MTRQCLFFASSLARFLSFPLTLPKRGGGYFSSPPARAGNLFVLPLWGRTRILYPIPLPVSSAKRDFLKFRRIQDEEDTKTIGQDTRTSYCPILLLVLESPQVERAARAFGELRIENLGRFKGLGNCARLPPAPVDHLTVLVPWMRPCASR